MGLTINGVLRTRWGSLIDLSTIMKTIERSLFRTSNLSMPDWMVLPTSAAWIMLGLFCAFCLFLLTRKVRAYEVVR
jgi:hypothetical protein